MYFGLFVFYSGQFESGLSMDSEWLAWRAFGILSFPMTWPPPGSIKVGVLGATGTVGQRFVLLLSTHPFFKLHALGASSRSAGIAYKKAVRWKQTSPIPECARDLVVRPCVAQEFAECAIVFSGLDADVAGDIGEWLWFAFGVY